MTLPGEDRDERGFVTVAVTGLMAVLLSVTGAVALLAGVAVARHRAATAADLAALAAASHALEGPAVACRAAGAVAAVHGAQLSRCELLGDEAVVEVRVSPTGPVGRWGHARGVARAGPVR